MNKDQILEIQISRELKEILTFFTLFKVLISLIAIWYKYTISCFLQRDFDQNQLVKVTPVSDNLNNSLNQYIKVK